jgi:hypothetical protein
LSISGWTFNLWDPLAPVYYFCVKPVTLRLKCKSKCKNEYTSSTAVKVDIHPPRNVLPWNLLCKNEITLWRGLDQNVDKSLDTFSTFSNQGTYLGVLRVSSAKFNSIFYNINNANLNSSITLKQWILEDTTSQCKAKWGQEST